MKKIAVAFIILIALVSIYKYKNLSETKIVGLIVPHHDVAHRLTKEIFNKVNLNDFDSVIIIGPNHYGIGGKEVVYSANKSIRNNSIDLSSLKNIDYDIQIKDSIFLKEHSIYEILKYTDNRKIVPIVLRSYFKKEKAEELSEKIYKAIENKSVLIIASVDFSHYLSIEEAYKKDKVTINLIEEKNYEEIYNLNADYLDSAPSLITFMKIMDFAKLEGKLVGHSNSYDEGVGRSDLTTSYLTYIFE
ncbi:MAG: AmmeMemoRadiSam system protein B [Clostridia bacterium]|jgi:AmmeMemoRadiSam system protein B|nr:AmmeMemoRadiSam system protein B [Clostridia bacterium]